MEMTNSRRMRRMRALKGARFIVNTAGGGVDCMIVDLNSCGARIRFSDPVIPKIDVTDLLIFPENISAPCRVMWRRGMEMGIKFDQPLAWLSKHDVSLAVPAVA